METNDISSLTQLESEALNWLLRGDDPVLSALRNQLEYATIISREMTGVGFYVYFGLLPEAPTLPTSSLIRPDFYVGDVEASVDPLRSGVGFLLWIKDRKLFFLEGHTFGEEWPEQLNQFVMSYIGGVRNMEVLRKRWSPSVSS